MDQCLECCAYRPTNTLLDLLSVAHVNKATAGWSVNRVFGAEFRAVDVARYETTDD